MLKTTFDQDGWERGGEYQSQRKEHLSQRKEEKGLRHRKKLSLATDDLAEILYLLQVKPERDFDTGMIDPKKITTSSQNRQNLSNIRNNNLPNIAKDLSIALFQAFGQWPRGETGSVMLWRKLFEDGCEILRDEILHFEKSNLGPSRQSDPKTLQLRKLCNRIILNTIEKKMLFQKAWVMEDCHALKPRYLQALNKLLDSTTTGKTFPLGRLGCNIILLERKEKKTRNLKFLNEVSPKVLGSEYQHKQQADLLPVATIPGMVLLNSKQNLMARTCSLAYPGDKLGERVFGGGWVCVDRTERSSRGPIRVARYLGNPNENHDNLHYTHMRDTKNIGGNIRQLEAKFSEKNCCGYVVEKNGEMFDLKIFDNPNDFKALSRHFAEFLFGTFSLPPKGQDIEINSEKILKITTPQVKEIWGIKLENHGLSSFNKQGDVKSIDCLRLKGKKQPEYMGIKI